AAHRQWQSGPRDQWANQESPTDAATARPDAGAPLLLEVGCPPPVCPRGAAGWPGPRPCLSSLSQACDGTFDTSIISSTRGKRPAGTVVLRLPGVDTGAEVRQEGPVVHGPPPPSPRGGRSFSDSMIRRMLDALPVSASTSTMAPDNRTS